ncbi:MAG: class I SAM-dependent RNA methyltransferase, partial [Pirellulaceae bacterium]|nr:class I SAM-dependent RNA methyltransferase [Pirellulaceae bacterium]
MTAFTTPSKILVTCNRGLAPFLASELAEMGLESEESLHTAVATYGTLDDCMRLNMNLRCASQVMYSLRSFKCADPEQLYEVILSIAWEKLLPADGYFTVHGNVHHPSIRSGMFANVKVKDAIVDRMRRETGRRPDTGAELLGAVVYLFWRGDTAEIFLDTSGETLSKHGYRKQPGPAPLVEALAAGMLRASHWDRQMPLVNPMCGSGTLAIEAALTATNRRPGLLRSSYAFMYLLGYDPRRYRAELKRLHEQIIEPDNLTIIASDMNRQTVQITRDNAEAAGVAQYIETAVCDFTNTRIPPAPGVIIFNPEYGQRMGEEEQLIGTYASIGDFMKHQCGGYWGYVYTGNMMLSKRIGLK